MTRQSGQYGPMERLLMYQHTPRPTKTVTVGSEASYLNKRPGRTSVSFCSCAANYENIAAGRLRAASSVVGAFRL